MPILSLQMRMRQLGEIRIGHVVATANGKTRPAKLDKFRFTSPSQAILTSVAESYGGTVQPWTPANGGPQEFEIYSESNRLPVIIPPMAVTQWFERFQGSKCVARCDGVTEMKSDSPCKCDPEARACSITTRLNVMLRDVPPVGLWLLSTHGYYAATELPPVADLLSRGNGHVAGWLAVEERRIVREKAGGGTETIRFMVPTLDIDLSPAQILSGSGGVGPQQIESATHTSSLPPHLAIEAKAPTAQMFADTALGATDADTLREIYREANAANLLDEQVTAVGKVGPLHEMLTILAKQYTATGPPPPAPSDDVKDRVAAWTAILSTWSGTTDEALAEFYRASQNREPADCTVAEIKTFGELMAVPVAEPEAQPALEQPGF